jgi:hypothetical protein
VGGVAGHQLRGGGGDRGLGGRPGGYGVHGSLSGGEKVRRYADDAPEGGVSGVAASPAELGDMTCCSTPRAAGAKGIRVDQHALVCAAICINQRDKGGQCEPRGDGDGDVGNTVGRPSEDLVFASENTCNILAIMLPDGSIW